MPQSVKVYAVTCKTFVRCSCLSCDNHRIYSSLNRKPDLISRDAMSLLIIPHIGLWSTAQQYFIEKNKREREGGGGRETAH